LLSAFIISPRQILANQKKLSSLFVLLTITFSAVAQDSVRIKPIRLTLIDHSKTTSFYQPFAFPLSKTIDYSTYPLTANEILRRNAQATAYNRVYNSLTNRNGNGFVRNLLGLQRVQRQHPSPGF
jgi:hypothetical protein